jgi:hypothetical protein
MKLRIIGYILVISGFAWSMNIILPSLYGNYLFMPAQEYRIPKDTGELVSAHGAFMQQQAIIQITQEKQSRMLYPLLMLLCGGIFLDVAGRIPRKSESEQAATRNH